MAYQISLTDSTGTEAMPDTEVPLTIETLEGAVDVTTLSYNVYTDFIALKRVWSHKWAYMTEDEYNTIRGFYERQFTLFEYPELTIADEGITNVTVRMSLDPKRIIDNCGTVEGVTVSWRETRQLGS